ncbi:phage major capsid protein [Neobacillus sp. Marseille-QA0830]
MSNKALLEERNEMLDVLDSLCEKIRTEKRGFKVAEQREVDRAKARINEIDMQLSLEKENRGGLDNMIETKKVDNPQAEQISKEERMFLELVKEGRAAGLGAGANGAVIPVSVANRVIDVIKQVSPIVRLATTYTVKGDLQLPSYDFQSHVVGFISEFTAGSAENLV